MAVIDIKGKHISGGESFYVKEAYDALYRFVNSKHVVKYVEHTEDGDNTVLLSVGNDNITIKRKGSINSIMVFEDDAGSVKYDASGMGLEFLIDLKKRDINIYGEKISIKLIYNILRDGELITESDINMIISI